MNLTSALNTPISLMLPAEVAAYLEDLARARGENRSQTLRGLLLGGLTCWVKAEGVPEEIDELRTAQVALLLARELRGAGKTRETAAAIEASEVEALDPGDITGLI